METQVGLQNFKNTPTEFNQASKSGVCKDVKTFPAVFLSSVYKPV